MKKINLLILLAIVVVADVWAQDLLSFSLVNGKEASVKCGSAPKSLVGKIEIPESTVINGITYPVTQIANRAFYCCINMTELHLPKTITTIGTTVLEGCDQLASITVDADNPYLKSVNGVLFSASGKTILLYPPARDAESYVIPNGVDSLVGAFNYCRNLHSVTLPKTVTDIQSYSLWSTRLTTIITKTHFPPKVTGSWVYSAPDHSPTFYVPTGAADNYKGADGWSNMTNILEMDMDDVDDNPFEFTVIKNKSLAVKAKSDRVCGKMLIPETAEVDGTTYPVTRIPAWAFSNRRVTEVLIPATIETIGFYAFESNSTLKTVTAKHYYPIEIDDMAFGSDTYQTATLYVPTGAKAFYQATTGWKNFKNIEEKDMEGTDDESFTYQIINDDEVSVKARDTRLMGKVQIPEKVEIDGRMRTVTQIAKWGFNGCSKLSEIGIPATLKLIDSWAFKGCQQLERFSVADGNPLLKAVDGILFTVSGKTLYRYPTGRQDEEYRIPDDVDSLYTEAFYENTALKSVVIPQHVGSIGYYAFKGCTSLTSITLRIFFPPTITNDVFETDGVSDRTFYIPTGSSVNYMNVNPWKSYNYQEQDMEGIDSDPLEFNVIAENKVAVRTKYATVAGAIVIPEQVEIDGKSYDVTTISRIAAGVTDITIPSTVDYIEYGALSGCTHLKTITVRQFYPFEINYDTFPLNYVFTTTKLLIPTGSKTVYQQMKYWKKFVNIEEQDMEGVDDSPLKFTVISDNGVAAQAVSRYIYGDLVIPETTIVNGQTYTVTEIPDKAFSGCSLLTSITIPKTVTQISDDFSSCTLLERFVVEAGNTEYKSTGGLLLSNGGGSLKAVPCAMNVEELVVPDGVEGIANFILSGNPYIKSIRLPASVQHVDCYTFMGAEVLAIVVDEGNATLKSIDGVLFNKEGNNLLCYPTGKTDAEYTIPDNTITVGQYAFYANKHLKHLVISESVADISANAFGGCSALESITVANYYPVPVTPGAFYSQVYAQATLYVPTDTKASYVATTEWGRFTHIEETDIPVSKEMLTYIKGTLYGKEVLEANPRHKGIVGVVTVPETVEMDGQTYTVVALGHFTNCTKITQISIPKTVTFIDGTLDDPIVTCFNGCSSLEKFIVDPENPFVKTRDDVLYSVNGKTLYAYPGGKKDEVFSIPTDIDELYPQAFCRNPYIQSVTIPNNIKTAGNNIFLGCTALRTVILKQRKPRLSGGSFSSQTQEQGTLYVPKGSANFYKEDIGWSRFAHIEEMDFPESEISSSVYDIADDNHMAFGYYIGDNYANGVGYGGATAGRYKYAIGFTPGDIRPFAGNSISNIRFALNTTDIHDVKVWIAASRYEQPLYEQEVTSVKEGWNEVALDVPFVVTDDSLFMGVEYRQDKELYPMSCSRYKFYAERGSCYAYGPCGGQGQYAWDSIDDICISIQCLLEGNNLPQNLLHAFKIAHQKRYYQKGTQMQAYFYLKNWGKKAARQFTLETQLDGVEQPDVEGSPLSSVDHGGYGASYVKTLLPDNLTAGRHTLRVRVKDINGAAPENDNSITQEVQFNSYTEDMGRQKTLMQVYTGTWCPNSPNIKRIVESAVNSGKYAVVCSHIDDELTCQAGKAYNRAFALHYPQVFYDRYAPEGEDEMLSNDYDEKQPSFANVNITASYDETERVLSVKVTGTKNQDFDAVIGTTNLTVLLTEDDIVAEQMDNTAGIIPDYVHHAVLRANLSDVWGDAVTWDGNQYQKNYQVRINADWVKNNMHVVAFLGKSFTGSNYGDLHVVNCNDFAVKDANVLESILGDSNGDGDVDIADAVCIVNYVVGKTNTAFLEAAADANSDGEVDIADAVHIVNYVVGKINALAPKFEGNQSEPE
jgi:hypothetical protein